jgi:hypothetical protein
VHPLGGSSLPGGARRLLLLCLAVAAWLLLAGRASAQSDEACFAARVNAERAGVGLPPMPTNQSLVEVARRHSEEMASSGTIYHNPGLAGQVPGKWVLVGENVGEGPTCDLVHEALMRSPLHRANILEPKFNALGMGTVVADGQIFVTQVFMQTKAAAAQPAPARPAPPAQPPPPPPAGPKPSPPPKPAPSPKPAPPPKSSPPPKPVAPPPPSSPSPAVSVQGTMAVSPTPANRPSGGGSPVGIVLVAGGAAVLGTGAWVYLRRLGRRRR